MAEDVDALIEGIVEDAVGPAFDVDCLDESLRFGVPHGDGFAAREAAVDLGVDGGSAGIGVGDFAGGGEGVGVEDGDAGGGSVLNGSTGDVETASVVGEDVVESAGASDFGGFQDFVGLSVGRRCEDRKREKNLSHDADYTPSAKRGGIGLRWRSENSPPVHSQPKA